MNISKNSSMRNKSISCRAIQKITLWYSCDHRLAKSHLNDSSQTFRINLNSSGIRYAIIQLRDYAMRKWQTINPSSFASIVRNSFAIVVNPFVAGAGPQYAINAKFMRRVISQTLQMETSKRAIQISLAVPNVWSIASHVGKRIRKHMCCINAKSASRQSAPTASLPVENANGESIAMTAWYSAKTAAKNYVWHANVLASNARINSAVGSAVRSTVLSVRLLYAKRTSKLQSR